MLAADDADHADVAKVLESVRCNKTKTKCAFTYFKSKGEAKTYHYTEEVAKWEVASEEDLEEDKE